MANEIQSVGPTGKTLYALIRNSTGLIWNTSALAFQSYVTLTYTDYDILMTEQGSASGFYVGTFPASIISGVYSIVVKQQLGGSVAESDPVISVGDIQWNATTGTVSYLAATITDSSFANYFPLEVAYGVQVLNFPFKLVSSQDHVTPFVSGIVSGAISRNGGAFGPLQSGAFTEMGRGWYSLQALTSGDLAGNTVALEFSANGISGGQADVRPFSFVLQRVSGH